jgi:hypothetical protein
MSRSNTTILFIHLLIRNFFGQCGNHQAVYKNKKENAHTYKQLKGKAVSTVTGLEWPRGFQEVKVPRFHDNGIGWW